MTQSDLREEAPEAGSSEYVVRAAMACYERYGLTRTSMDDIAKEAGVTRAALYYHFPGRMSLVSEVLVREVDRVLTDVEAQLVDAPDGLAALLDAMELLIEAAFEDQYAAIFLGNGNEKLTAAVVTDERVMTRMLRFWDPLLERARAAGELRDDLSR